MIRARSPALRVTLRTSVGLAREEDRTPDTTPQNTLMTIVSSDVKDTGNDHSHTAAKCSDFKQNGKRRNERFAEQTFLTDWISFSLPFLQLSLNSFY